jgi:hypothetical protein
MRFSKYYATSYGFVHAFATGKDLKDLLANLYVVDQKDRDVAVDDKTLETIHKDIAHAVATQETPP